MYKMQNKETPDAPKLSPRRIRLRVQKKRTRESSDEDIKEISDGVNGLTLESKSKTKIPTRKRKRQKKFINITENDIKKVKKCVNNLLSIHKKRLSYKFNERFPIQQADELNENHIAIVPIIPEFKNIKEYSKNKVKMDDDIIQRENCLNPLFINDIVFTSALTDRNGAFVFYPESKFSKFLNKKKNKNKDKNVSKNTEDGAETKNNWDNMDSETILKIFKNTFNIVSKKPNKIIKTKYFQYSPNLGVFLVILKGKEYKLKNKNYGDKHYPWIWQHLWDHYNNWIPDYENNVFRRYGNPYMSILVSDVSMANWEIKYRFDEPVQKPDKRLFHKMTWRFIYEELAKC